MVPSEDDRRRTQSALVVATGCEKLSFGCGPYALAGWTNIDNGDGVNYAAPEHDGVIHLDIFEALAVLPPASTAFITSEHLFEHFSLDDGHRVLRGWFAALRPGGVVRIVTPDLERESLLYLRQLHVADDTTIEAHRLRWLGTRCELARGERLTRAMVLNYGMRLDGHKFVYDQETLTQSMRLAGFEQIVRVECGESAHAELSAIEVHDGGDTGRSFVPKLALILEGTKPAA